MNKKGIKLAIEAMEEYFRESAGVILQTFENPLLIGYFDDYNKVAAALKADGIERIYAPLHEVSENCIKRLPYNKLASLNKGMGVSAKDMKNYRAFFIDIDTKCEHIDGVKQNATEEQHKNAIELGEEVREYLCGLGWGMPYFVDSGNGVHLLYHLSLESTKENSMLIKEALSALSEKFSCEKGDIDTVTYDISRKIKIPGSGNNEGENHRISRILSIPEDEEKITITEKMLKKLASLWSGKKVPKISKDSESKPDMDDMIAVIESIGEYYFDTSGSIYVDVPAEPEAITYSVDSRQFNLLVRRRLKEKLNIKVVRNDFWQQLSGYLKLLADESGRREDIRNRITMRDGNIYYDLQSEDNAMIGIEEKKITIYYVLPGYFFKNDTDKPQLCPDLDTKRTQLVGLLDEIFNFSKKKDTELFALWLVSCFFPDDEHPILWMTGAQGTAKSTACGIIQDIVSPQTIERSTFPRKREDLILSLMKRYLVVYDNVGYISDDASNILCQAVTGGSSSKRKLYTDTEMVTIPLRSIVILNSIEPVINKPDLLSRVLQFNLAKIDRGKVCPDFLVRSRTAEKIPKILGAIFDCIRTVLTLKKKLPKINYVIRLAGFQHLATKIGMALGMDPGYVVSLLEENKKDVDTHILESNPVAYLVEKFMEDKPEWIGSVQDFYNELCYLAADLDVDKRNRLFPKSASALSAKLNSLQSMLEEVGIEFEIKNVRTHKQITVTHIGYAKSSAKVRKYEEPEEEEYEEDEELEFDE